MLGIRAHPEQQHASTKQADRPPKAHAVQARQLTWGIAASMADTGWSKPSFYLCCR